MLNFVRKNSLQIFLLTVIFLSFTTSKVNAFYLDMDRDFNSNNQFSLLSEVSQVRDVFTFRKARVSFVLNSFKNLSHSLPQQIALVNTPEIFVFDNLSPAFLSSKKITLLDDRLSNLIQKEFYTLNDLAIKLNLNNSDRREKLLSATQEKNYVIGNNLAHLSLQLPHVFLLNNFSIAKIRGLQIALKESNITSNIPKVVEIKLLPVYALSNTGNNINQGMVLGAYTSSESTSATGRKNLPFLDQLSLSLFCGLSSLTTSVNDARCNYNLLVSPPSSSLQKSSVNSTTTPLTISNLDPSAGEAGSRLRGNDTGKTSSKPSSNTPTYITEYITKYITLEGKQGPAGKDGISGKDGLNGKDSSQSQGGFGGYVTPVNNYFPPTPSASLIGVSTISYLRDTTLDYAKLNYGTSTNQYLQNAIVNNGVFNGGSLFNDSVSFTGNVIVNNLTASTTNLTNATSTNHYITNLSALDSLFTNSTTTNSFVTNLAITNATTTNATTTNSFTTNATSTNHYITNLSALNSLFTNSTTTNATSTNLYSTSATLANATSTNFFSTNSFLTNGTSTNHYITNLEAVNSLFTNSTSTNSFATNSTSTNLYSTSATLVNATSTNLFSTNSFLTNGTSTNHYITNLVANDSLFTNSTTTNSFATNSTSTNLYSNSASFGVLSATSATLVNGTTTNFFTTNLAVGTVNTSGNQTINGTLNVNGTTLIGSNTTIQGSVTLGTSTSNFITVNGLFNSNITPAANISYDLGTPSLYWRNVYAGTVTANSFSAASTSISGTNSTSFSINSSNASTDTQDSSLVFFRGIVTPNAILRWNSLTKRLESNMSLHIENETPATGTTTFSVQGGQGQGGVNLFELRNNSGTLLSFFNSNGGLSVNENINASGTLNVSGTSTLATTTIVGTLTVNGNTNITQGGILTVGDKVIAPGEIGAGTSSPSGKIAIQSTNADQVAFLIYGTSTQTAPLISVFDYPGSNQNIFQVSATGTLTTKDIFGTSGTFSSALSVLGQTTLANASTTNLSVSGMLYAPTLSSSNVLFTNATSTNLFTSILNAVTGTINNLTGGSITATSSLTSNGTLNVTGLTTLTNASTTAISGTGLNFTNGFITNATLTNASTTNLSANGFFSTNAFVTGFTATNASTTNLSATGATLASLFSTDATLTNASTTNLSAVGATLASLFSSNATLTNATSTNSYSSNLSSTNSMNTNATSTNFSATNATLSNATITNATITSASIGNASTTNLTVASTTYFANNTGIWNAIGNVGIGTTTPSGKLAITGGGTTTGRAFAVADSSNVDNFFVLDNGNAYMKGNVGIGTTGPLAKLHVSTSDSATTIGGATPAVLVQNTNATTGALNTLMFLNKDGYGSAAIYTKQTNNGNNGDNLFFNTKQNPGASWNTGMVLDTSGNVGIGTTGPNQKLELGGGGAYTPRIRFSHGTAGYFADWGYNSDGNKVYLTITDGSVAKNVLVANYDGNVGIGTTTPGSKLSVNGDSYFAGNIYATGTINVLGQSTFVNASTTNLSATGATLTSLYSTSASFGVLSASSAAIAGAITGATSFNGLVITPNTGVVTTGTWNASQIANAYIATGLDVTKLTTGTTLPSNVLTSSLTTVGALASGSIASGFGTIATANTITGTTLNGTTGINTGATAGTQRIDASGNLVNIGTISSGAITSGLINGQTISATANFTGSLTAVNDINLNDNLATGKLAIGSFGSYLGRQSSDGSTVLQTGQAHLLLNPTGGNVGVGTTSPNSILYINGGQGVPATSGYMNTGVIIASGAGGPALNIGVQSAGNPGSYSWISSAYQNNAGVYQYLALQPNGGNVGIGTTTPSEKLDVVGNINIPTTSSTVGAIKQNGTLFMHSFGTMNLFLGENAGNVTLTGIENAGVGYNALKNISSGSYNTAVGRSALGAGNSSENSAFGRYSLYNATGGYNSALGNTSLYGITSGAFNVGIGKDAGRTVTTGTYNTFVGYASGYNASQKIDAVNSMALGNGAYTTADNQVVIGNTSVTQTLLNGNVGIGTIAPGAKLHVASSGGTNAFVVGTSVNGEGAVVIKPNYASGIASIQGTNSQLSAVANLAINPEGGNVGIGTSSPSALLTLSKTNSSGTYTDKSSSAIVIDNPTGTQTMLGFSYASVIKGNIRVDNGGGFILNSANNNFYLNNDVGSSLATLNIPSSGLNITGGNVGIGVASPGTKLDVAGTVRSSTQLRVDVGAGAWLLNTDGVGNTLAQISRQGGGPGGNDMAMQAYGGFSFAPGNSSTVKVYINDSGNVGIGTTTPLGALVVQSAANVSSLNEAQIIAAANGSSPFGAAVRIDSRAISGGHNWMLFSSGGSAGEGQGKFIVSDNNTNRLAIDTSGNVGIGTAAPATIGDGGTIQLLQVHNAGTSANAQSLLQLTTGATTNAGAVGAITWGATNATGEKRVAEITGTISAGSASSPSGQLDFYTNNAGTLGSKMTIQAGGNVGIGTTGPTYAKLDVRDTNTIVQVRSTLSSIVTGSNNGGALYFGVDNTNSAITPTAAIETSWGGATTPQIGIGVIRDALKANILMDYNGTTQIRNGTTATLYANSSGYVGIGTASPGSQLQVNSATVDSGIWVSAPTTHYGYLRLKSNTGYWDVRTNDTAAATFTGANDFSIGQSGGASQFLIQSTTGNVGIGKTNPLQKLDVKGALRISNTVGEGGDYDNYPVIISSNYSSEAMKITAYAGNEYFGVYGWTNTALGLAGNVGIGTTGPGQLLSVIDGSNTKSVQLRLGNNESTYNYDIGRSVSTGLLGFYGNQTGATGYSFGGVDGTRMTIDTAGNVGIGTTAPGAKLHVYENAALAAMRITNIHASGYTGIELMKKDNSTVGTYFGLNNDDTYFRFNTIDKPLGIIGGNVGIGTTAPGAKLDVYQAGGASVINLTSNLTTGLTGALVGYGLNSSSATTYFSGVYNGISSNTASAESGYLAMYTRNAGAWGERMRIDNAGNVGIGTTTPGYKLDVLATSGNGTQARFGNNTFFSEFNNESHVTSGADLNSGGTWTARTASAVDFNINASAGGAIQFNRKTGLTPGNSFTWDTTMTLQNDGNVGIGTVGPFAKFQVKASQATSSQSFSVASPLVLADGISLSATSDGNTYNTGMEFNASQYVLRIGNVGIGTGANPSYLLQVNGQPAANGYTAFTNYSDSRLKNNVTNLITDGSSALSKIVGLRPVTFNYNSLTGYSTSTQARRTSGFIAQELQQIFPEMVGTTTINGNEYFDTNLSDLPLYLINATQELNTITLQASSTLSNFITTANSSFSSASSSLLSLSSEFSSSFSSASSSISSLSNLITFNQNQASTSISSLFNLVNNNQIEVSSSTANIINLMNTNVTTLTTQISNITDRINLTNGKLNTLTLTSLGTVGIGNDGTSLGGELLRVSGRIRAQGFDIDNASDIAENFPASEAVDAGTVVAFSTTTIAWDTGGVSSEQYVVGSNATSSASTTNSSLPTTSYQMSTVRKALNGYEAVGVISTNSGIVLGSNTPNGVPVAFSGRIPVKVTTENGEVKQGDYLTVSITMPGYAMKLTGEGRSIGRAISDYEQGKDRVLMLVENGNQKLDLAGHNATTTGMLTLGNIDLNANGVSIINIKSIASANGSWSIDENGRIVGKVLCLEDVCINKDQLSQILSGTGVTGIVAGTSTTGGVVGSEQGVVGSNTTSTSTTVLPSSGTSSSAPLTSQSTASTTTDTTTTATTTDPVTPPTTTTTTTTDTATTTDPTPVTSPAIDTTPIIAPIVDTTPLPTVDPTATP